MHIDPDLKIHSDKQYTNLVMKAIIYNLSRNIRALYKDELGKISSIRVRLMTPDLLPFKIIKLLVPPIGEITSNIAGSLRLDACTCNLNLIATISNYQALWQFILGHSEKNMTTKYSIK